MKLALDWVWNLFDLISFKDRNKKLRYTQKRSSKRNLGINQLLFHNCNSIQFTSQFMKGVLYKDIIHPTLEAAISMIKCVRKFSFVISHSIKNKLPCCSVIIKRQSQ